MKRTDRVLSSDPRYWVIIAAFKYKYKCSRILEVRDVGEGIFQARCDRYHKKGCTFTTIQPRARLSLASLFNPPPENP